MKRPLEYALWCDCETDDERAVFLHSGRAIETGVVAPILAPELAEVFMDRASLRAEVERLKAENTQANEWISRLAKLLWKKYYAEKAPEWGPFTDLVGVISQLDNMIAGMNETMSSLEADAKLGRMMRAMPEGCGLYRHVGGYYTGRFEGVYARGTATPEEALEKAGVKAGISDRKSTHVCQDCVSHTNRCYSCVEGSNKQVATKA